MDDRRFDSLVKAMATGTNRRSLFKGLLGLGGAAVVGTSLQGSEADAARRPTPTPKPITCPGSQIWNGSACVCPGTAPDKCGPDCCTESITLPDTPGYSECCDNACCFGHCYGEELCCDYPLVFCEAQNECCFADDNQCCGSTGCCDTACCPIADGSNACCEDPTPRCCGGDACIPADGCCSDDECSGCQTCQNHICADDNDQCAGCLDCVQAACVTNNGNCEDGLVCTDNICGADGNCSYPFDCTNSDSCCDDGNACTQNICNTEAGTCSFPFYCTSNDCCPGQVCDTSTGGCYTPCQDENFGSCSDVPCCNGLTCVEVPGIADFCFECIPSTYEGIPIPCVGFCDLCCNYDYLGFCVDCNPPFNSCEDNENSCCDGLCCQYNPVGDNFCSVACI